jgi:hypothetical protein
VSTPAENRPVVAILAGKRTVSHSRSRMAGLAASAFHLMVACCRISCSARYLARRAWEIRPRQRYPARKPKGKPIKAAIARSNILVPGTILELGRYSYYFSLVCCERMAAAPYCRASPRGLLSLKIGLTNMNDDRELIPRSAGRERDAACPAVADEKAKSGGTFYSQARVDRVRRGFDARC